MQNTAFLFIISLFALTSCQNTGNVDPIVEDTTLATSNIKTPTITELSTKIKANNSDPNLYYDRAQAYLATNNAREAAKDLFKALDIDSTQARLYLSLADIYLGAGEIDRAMFLLQKGLRLNPKNVGLELQLGQYYFYLQKYQESINHINNALLIDIFKPQAYFLKGLNFKELGDTTKALSSFVTAVEQDPKYIDAYMQIGLLYAAQKNELAIDYFENAIKLNPKNMNAMYAKAKFYQDTKQFNKAIKSYKAIIPISRQNQSVFYNLGAIYYGLDSIEKARKNFNFAVKVDPTYSAAYSALGACAEVKGENEKAIKYFKQALRMDENNPIAIAGIERLENK